MRLAMILICALFPCSCRRAQAPMPDLFTDTAGAWHRTSLRELLCWREVHVLAVLEGGGRVARRPVERLPGLVHFVAVAGLHREPAPEHVTPVRAGAQVVGQARERWAEVGSLLEPDEGDGHVADLRQSHLDIVVLDCHGDVVAVDYAHFWCLLVEPRSI